MMYRLFRLFLETNGDSAFSHAGILVLRLAAGLFVAALHGWPKTVQGIAYIQHGTQWPLRETVEMLGLSFPTFWAFAAAITFLGGGLFIVAGFLTRFAALDVLGTLFMAIYANYQLGRDNQMAMLFAMLFTSIALCGAGRFSFDALLFGRRQKH